MASHRSLSPAPPTLAPRGKQRRRRTQNAAEQAKRVAFGTFWGRYNSEQAAKLRQEEQSR